METREQREEESHAGTGHWWNQTRDARSEDYGLCMWGARPTYRAKRHPNGPIMAERYLQVMLASSRCLFQHKTDLPAVQTCLWLKTCYSLLRLDLLFGVHFFISPSYIRLDYPAKETINSPTLYSPWTHLPLSARTLSSVDVSMLKAADVCQSRGWGSVSRARPGEWGLHVYSSVGRGLSLLNSCVWSMASNSSEPDNAEAWVWCVRRGCRSPPRGFWCCQFQGGHSAADLTGEAVNQKDEGWDLSDRLNFISWTL